MSGNVQISETAAWCSECKRLFEAFSEADYLWQNLISVVENAVLELDSAEIERLKIQAGDARRECQSIRENFVQHRNTHTQVRPAAA
jgi:hypothetical protein